MENSFCLTKSNRIRTKPMAAVIIFVLIPGKKVNSNGKTKKLVTSTVNIIFRTLIIVCNAIRSKGD